MKKTVILALALVLALVLALTVAGCSKAPAEPAVCFLNSCGDLVPQEGNVLAEVMVKDYSEYGLGYDPGVGQDAGVTGDVTLKGSGWTENWSMTTAQFTGGEGITALNFIFEITSEQAEESLIAVINGTEYPLIVTEAADGLEFVD